METVGRLSADRVQWLEREWAKEGWRRGERYFRDCFAAQERGEMVVLVAREGDELLGFLKVLWTSGYAWFRERQIPEVNDLYVAAAHRRQGVATRLMDAAEDVMRTRSPVAGIGVGLHPGYAAAQRMYALRGYAPDGNPLTYRSQPVIERQVLVLDDDLVMYLTKLL